MSCWKSRRHSRFQSTLPVRGGTGRETAEAGGYPISIHPPPWGEGPTIFFVASSVLLFQSTLPVWGGTYVSASCIFVGAISIHPPREGRDLPLMCEIPNFFDFNPPSPWGEGR